MAAAAKKAPTMSELIYRFLHKTSRFNQYGLKTHDLLRETPDVKEALRRIPDHVHDARAFRIHRAMHYSMLKRPLPQEEWISHDDPDNWYLKPYLEEVEKEFAERKEWAEK